MDADEHGRHVARNVAIVGWSHIMLRSGGREHTINTIVWSTKLSFSSVSLPWALHALVMLPLLQGWTVGMDAVTVCIVDGIFRLVLESW